MGFWGPHFAGIRQCMLKPNLPDQPEALKNLHRKDFIYILCYSSSFSQAIFTRPSGQGLGWEVERMQREVCSGP